MRALLTAFACLSGLLAGCTPENAGVAVAEAAPTSQTRGFVVSDFTFDQPESGPNACPQGFNKNEREFYLAGLTVEARADAAELPEAFDYLRMVRDRGGPDPCGEPAAYEDPAHVMWQGTVATGFDLDAVSSTSDSPAPQSCSHQDFADPSGAAGIDNQLWRVLGCIQGYQPGGTIDEYAIENIKSGGRTILIEITDLDDLRDDSDVGVAIYSSPDTIPAAANGMLLAGGSLGIADGPRHRTVTRGSLADGVVTAGPVDLRLDFDGQFLESELHLREARVRFELTPDGGLKGVIGGYWDIEDVYETYARQATRSGAFFVGFRCPALHAGLARVADRYPDPESGACSAVSTTFRVTAIPAFVVEPPSPAVAQVSASPSQAAY